MTEDIALAADHAGFPLKTELLAWLKALGYQTLDVGAFSVESDDDYPDYAEAIADAVVSVKARRGILICGSGVGACVADNKVPGVRACLCHDIYSAHQGVEHDDMNVLCLGSRIVGKELAKDLVTGFLNARFTDEERHRRRLEKVISIERRALQGERVQTTGRRA